MILYNHNCFCADTYVNLYRYYIKKILIVYLCARATSLNKYKKISVINVICGKLF
jgi:hypothetical protein